MTHGDIVVGTESWLDDTIRNAEVFPSGFEIYWHDRDVHGGGVYLVIDKSIHSVPVDLCDDNFESVLCKIILHNGEHLTVGSFSRSPSSSSLGPFWSLSNALQNGNTNLFLGGDFNMPRIQWINKYLLLSSQSAVPDEFSNMIETHGLYQFVGFPTRRTAESSFIFDLVFSNAGVLVQSITAIPGTGDHDGVLVKVSRNRPQKTISQPRKV